MIITGKGKMATKMLELYTPAGFLVHIPGANVSVVIEEAIDKSIPIVGPPALSYSLKRKVTYIGKFLKSKDPFPEKVIWLYGGKVKGFYQTYSTILLIKKK